MEPVTVVTMLYSLADRAAAHAENQARLELIMAKIDPESEEGVFYRNQVHMMSWKAAYVERCKIVGFPVNIPPDDVILNR